MDERWTAQRIRELRKKLGLTQTEFAKRLGYSHYIPVSDLERGEQRPSGPVQKLLHMLEKEARKP